MSSSTTLQVNLTEENDPNPITASLTSFLRFASEIDADLEKLEFRFQHCLTNNSTRATLLSDRKN